MNVIATVEAFQLAPDVARRLLARHGLPQDASEAAMPFPVQKWLDALRDIAKQVGQAKLRAVGAKVIEVALFPPQFETVESVLLSLDAIYRMNHRGDVGCYRSVEEANGRIRIDCETPYPRAFERGLIEGIARHRSLTNGRRYEIVYQDAVGCGHEDRTCRITVGSVETRLSISPISLTRSSERPPPTTPSLGRIRTPH